MIFLDTGYFVALLDHRDELHVRALAWSKAIQEPALVTEYVLVETVNLLSHPADRPGVHMLLRQIASSPGYRVIDADRKLFELGCNLHLDRPDKEWSLTDCISFEVMRQRGITRALAYDNHFEQAGFEALLRREVNVSWRDLG
jgi:predicted nucleic acid-binding protein